MSEKNILFSPAMVLAINEDRKTQTRRVVKPQFWFDATKISESPAGSGRWWDDIGEIPHACPYGIPGNILLVKESVWMFCEAVPNGTTPKGKPKFHYQPLRSTPLFYQANMEKGWRPKVTPEHPETGNKWLWRLKIGRFLPKWAVRTRLEVVGIRVERLKECSIVDAIAEGLKAITKDGGQTTKYGIPDRDGMPGNDDHGWHWEYWRQSPVDAYQRLWESINCPGSWEANPWVWVVTFKRIGGAA